MRTLTGYLLSPGGAPLANYLLRCTARESTLTGVPAGAVTDIPVNASGIYTSGIEPGNYALSVVSPQGTVTPIGFATVTDGPDTDIFTLMATPAVTPEAVRALLDTIIIDGGTWA